jgi:hypothetical protein
MAAVWCGEYIQSPQVEEGTSAMRCALARLRARPRERGAVVVETALVMTMLLTILFGIVEVAMLIRDGLTISSAVRSGARMASSQPRQEAFKQTAADQVAAGLQDTNMSGFREFWIYRADTAGRPLSGNFTSCTSGCVRFRWDAASRSFVKTFDSYSASSQNACAGDANNDRIGVYLSLDHQSLSGLIFDQRRLSEATVMRLEPKVGTSVCKP